MSECTGVVVTFQQILKHLAYLSEDVSLRRWGLSVLGSQPLIVLASEHHIKHGHGLFRCMRSFLGEPNTVMHFWEEVGLEWVCPWEVRNGLHRLSDENSVPLNNGNSDTASSTGKECAQAAPSAQVSTSKFPLRMALQVWGAKMRNQSSAKKTPP
eukprot:1453971-Amphidinium_carterae.1